MSLVASVGISLESCHARHPAKAPKFSDEGDSAGSPSMHRLPGRVKRTTLSGTKASGEAVSNHQHILILSYWCYEKMPETVVTNPWLSVYRQW